MTVRITFNETGPITQFLCDADYVGMSIDGNYSIVDVRIRNINTGSGTSSWYGGAGTHTGSIDGVGEFARRQVSSGFLPRVASDVTRWNLYKRVHIPHNTDGTRSNAIIRMHVDYGSITRDGSYSLALPTIPRATTPRFRVGSTDVTSFDAGAAVTVFLDRASSSFTHDVTYTFGSASGTIATGAGVSAAWTPPLSLLTEIPGATSGTGTVKVVTKNGSTVIGTKTKNFTLRAPASVVPTITGINITDDNPDVASLIGVLVQGQSRLKATVVASGVYGSTITAAMVTVDGQTVPSGQSLPLPASGTRVVAAAVTDSRGRTASDSGTVTVLPYDTPQINNFSVRRATSGGTPSDTGTYLLLALDAAVSSLINGTQKNAMKVTVATRPRGGSAWTTRNVINTGLTYNTSVLVTGGGIFATNTAWDVRVTVADKLDASIDFFLAPTAGAILDATDGKLALGKMVEAGGPAMQVQGPGRLYDTWNVDGRRILDLGDFATTPETISGDDDDKAVTPAGLKAALTATDTDWVDLSSYLAPGINYSADGDPALAGIKAMRSGRVVMLSLGNFVVDSMDVPTTGNVANRLILTGIPSQFRPVGRAAVTPAWNGRLWAGHITPDGDVFFDATVPTITGTGTATWTDQMYSGTATYIAAN